MRACIVGDSHAAMLVGGHARLAPKDLEITVFAEAGKGPQEFSFEGSVLSAQGRKLKRTLDRMGTPHRLDMSSFDLLILVSRTATPFTILDILKGYRVSDWISTRESAFRRKIVDPDIALPDERLVTKAAVQTTLTAMIKANDTFRFCEQVRNFSRAPIFIVPSPLPAEHTLKHRPRFFGLKRALTREDGDELRDCVQQSHFAAFQELDDVTIITQPEETIVHGCLTKAEFGRDSVRLASTQQHEETDILHAGPKMGALILQDILRHLSTRQT